MKAMTHDDRKALGKALAATAFYYGRQLSPEIVSMMLDDLADLPVAATLAALKAYRLDAKNRAFPMPAQIRAIVRPEVDSDAAAREIAARIAGAIPKFGWCNGQAAREYIGEVGWQIVQSQGGWSYLCENMGLRIDPSSFQAQVREQAKARVNFTPEQMAVAIGAAPKPQGLASAADILKLIKAKREE